MLAKNWIQKYYNGFIPSDPQTMDAKTFSFSSITKSFVIATPIPILLLLMFLFFIILILTIIYSSINSHSLFSLLLLSLWHSLMCMHENRILLIDRNSAESSQFGFFTLSKSKQFDALSIYIAMKLLWLTFWNPSLLRWNNIKHYKMYLLLHLYSMNQLSTK